MPLPFPAVLTRREDRQVDDREEISFKKGINLCVAALNWLHLRRPTSCPEALWLFTPLKPTQWRVVRQIERCMLAWKEIDPITAEDIGRSAGKVESIEGAVSQLSLFLDSWTADLISSHCYRSMFRFLQIHT